LHPAQIQTHLALFIGRSLAGGKQLWRAWRCRLGVTNLEGRFPVDELLVVQFAKIQDAALDDFVAGAASVFDDASVMVLFAIFPSRGAA